MIGKIALEGAKVLQRKSRDGHRNASVSKGFRDLKDGEARSA